MQKMQKGTLYCIGLVILVVVLFALNLVVGSVRIPAADVLSILMGDESAKPSWQFIVMESRLPQAITGMLCGAALAVSGLMLQTAFRNPLAGPSIFGINSGAGLGVALVMLLLGGSLSAGSVSISGFVAILVAAFIGAMAVMAIIFFFSAIFPTQPSRYSISLPPMRVSSRIWCGAWDRLAASRCR